MDIRWIIDFIRNNFGDIGTSPLYVMRAILDHIISADIVLGISAVFWTLTLQTTIKYVINA
jgi:KUP system potassium uptake protein